MSINPMRSSNCLPTPLFSPQNKGCVFFPDIKTVGRAALGAAVTELRARLFGVYTGSISGGCVGPKLPAQERILSFVAVPTLPHLTGIAARAAAQKVGSVFAETIGVTIRAETEKPADKTNLC